MVDPAVDSMIEESSSKYALVVAVARRARELVDGDDLDARAYPVTHALWEMANGYVGVDDWSETYGYGPSGADEETEDYGTVLADDAGDARAGKTTAPSAKRSRKQ